jgi:cell division protein FtsZ
MAASIPSQGLQAQKQAPAVKPFVPAPPSAAPRAVRRMPNVEEFPLPVQNEIKARSGEGAPVGLQAQKKKVGFLERLTGVAMGRKDEDASLGAKREPEFGQPRQVQPALKSVETLPKGLKIERPPSDSIVTAVPKRIESQVNVIAMEAREAPDESPVEDDLEIPAFLRRRAK